MYRRLPSPLSQTHGFHRLLLRVLGTPGEFPKHPSSPLPCLSHSLSSRNGHPSDQRLGFVRRELEELQSLKPITNTRRQEPEGGGGGERGRGGREEECSEEVEISHPWPEWVEFMEKLLKKGYLDHYGLQRVSSTSKDSNHIRTACLNFARDRFELIRYFSRKDIRIIVGSGCPSLDRKVVNSGKRLRAYVGIEEGTVCSSCNLRGSCERAYVKAREDEGGRTMDVIRILLTYGLDLMTGSAENQPCLNKMVKESVRRLLNEVVEFGVRELDFNPQEVTSEKLSSRSERSSSGKQLPRSQIDVLMKQGDWICPKCNFLNFAKNVKCLRCNGVSQEKLKKLKGDSEHLPLKKGDWICEKCNFLNFAKNTKCLQCGEKPPARHLNPGEWECVSCNYVNFRRNMVCLKCDWKRPKASNSGESSAASRHDNGGHPNHSRITFVRNGNEQQRDVRAAREEDADFWRCGEGDDNPGEFTELGDFPGGKSTTSSKNLLERQRWKGERGASRETTGEEGNGGSTSSNRVRFEFDESGSEDEMAGWFGYESK